MTELLTAAQMRAIEAAAIASGAVTGLELMERAGQGVVQAVFAEWPELQAGSFRAVVLCGPGNNGGDGFVVARLLKEWGWEVEVFLYGTPEGMPPDARVNYERWMGMGEVIGPDVNKDFLPPIYAPGYALMVDALFGIGLARDLSAWPHMIDFFASIGDPGMVGPLRKVSVDIPTGICADSGRLIGIAAFTSDLTVTFHRRKIGHITAYGSEAAGKLAVVDIGLPLHFNPSPFLPPDRVFAMEVIGPGRFWGNRPLKKEAFARLSGEHGAHKFSHGHALILSGPPGHGGAARMTARGALRIGAGLVTLACPPEALPENAAHLNAIMLKPVADGAGLAEVLADPRITALCLGPGLGLDQRAEGLVAAALGSRGVPRPTQAATPAEGTSAARMDNRDAPPPVGRGAPRLSLVLDADALTLISRNPDLFAALHPNCVLTPHAGEFARLFPDIAAKLEAPATKGPAYSKVDATREAAKRANCTVLYKGPDTVIASPDGTCAINSAAYDRAAPWLATAGSGDVLAGFITGLLARGFAPQQAAETGAWLHVECARSFGPGLIAEDLPEELPKVFRALGL